jgi:hypothetical protein
LRAPSELRRPTDPSLQTLTRSRPHSTPVPDLRDTLRSITADELAKILDAFDVTATYDKPNRASSLPPPLKHTDRHKGGRGNLQVAGAGFEPATFGL